ncbi:hypothetical protein QR680_005816 [Steinernema hermaphroditum]|uniref:Potassium channel domain-containing protein n=1 Tax=Steinernema hermaphroditum TaxID=289476 RepID=A0AA39HTG8_9BILA|nr:hypothetical protein QR680_005816 [Steinernema hermaphroditum]
MADSHLYPRLKWAYRRFKFNYLLPVVILVLYTLVGAAMFRNMEMEKDEQARAVFRQSTDYAFNQVLNRMLEVHCNDVVLKVNKTSQIRHAKDALVWFMDYLNLTQVIQERSEETPWTWVGSMFYAGQLYTTIGYGLPFAKTGTGQFASVIYIFIGIPLFLIILKEEGKLMSRGLRKLYKRLHSAKQKLPEAPQPIRRMSQPVRAMYNLSPLSLIVDGSPSKKGQTVIDVEMEPDPEKQNAINEERVRQTSFPISLALSILGMWILFSAWFFSVWEVEWGLTTSVYFFFVSISTVGLGDIIASNPDMMIVYFILILVGLALLSMCINLIQARIEEILDRLLMEHIQKIEKMAKIVANDDCYEDETTTPFEIEAANELLTKPLEAFAHPPETGLWAVSRLVKGMMAGLANDMIADRLGLESEESDEDTVEAEPEEEAAELHVEKEESKPFRIKNLRRVGMLSLLSPQVMRTLQTLQHYQDKSCRASDFKSMLFSQFISSEKVKKAVESEARKMVSCSMQTDPIPIRVLAKQTSEVPFCRIETPISLTTTEADTPKKSTNGTDMDTVSSSFDADSMYSVAYYDLKFDYGTETVPMGTPLPLRRKHLFNSAISMGMDEEFDESMAFFDASPKLHHAVRRTSTMGISLTVPEIEPGRRETRRIERCPSHLSEDRSKESASKVSNDLPEYRHSTHIDPQSLARLGELCGLLPNDFRPGSSSQMEDSGCYDENSSIEEHPAPPKPRPPSQMERLSEEVVRIGGDVARSESDD